MFHNFGNSKKYSKVILPKPYAKYDLDGNRIKTTGEVVYDISSIFTGSLRILLISHILIFAAILIGLFTFPLTQLTEYSLKNILDAIFKQPFPDLKIIIATIFTGLIFGLAYFGHLYKRDPNYEEQRASTPTVFFACLGVILIFNYYYFDLVATQIINGDFDINKYTRLIFSQTVAATSILLFMSFFIQKATKVDITKINITYSERINKIYGLLKFLIILIIFDFLVAYIVTRNIDPHLNPPLEKIVPLSIPINVSLVYAGSLIAGLVIASVFYWPKSLLLQNGFVNFIRLVVIVGGIFLIGYIYRHSPQTDGYVAAVIVMSCLMVFAAPLHKTLS